MYGFCGAANFTHLMTNCDTMRVCTKDYRGLVFKCKNIRICNIYDINTVAAQKQMGTALWVRLNE